MKNRVVEALEDYLKEDDLNEIDPDVGDSLAYSVGEGSYEDEWRHSPYLKRS